MHELAVDCPVGAPGFSEEFHDMARCNSGIPSFNSDDEAGCSCHRLWKRPRALMPKETFAHRKTEHLETCAQIVRLWTKNSRFRHSSANRQDVERLNRAIEYLQNRMQQYKEEPQRGGDPEATLHALADEILKYRRALRLLAQAIGWADAGTPFALIAPGPHWRNARRG